MKLNNASTILSSLKRWVATALLCMLATVFAWQGLFSTNLVALAYSSTNLVAVGDLGDKVKEKVSNDTGRAKDFVQDTKEQVQNAAKTNASKVDEATDNETDFIGRKAKKDKGRIEAKADKDSARTQNAIDKTGNAVKRTVDNIKDSLGG